MASSGFVEVARKSFAMGPSVRNLLMKYQLDPSTITSTGPHKILLKSDVLDYIGRKSSTPQSLSSSVQDLAQKNNLSSSTVAIFSQKSSYNTKLRIIRTSDTSIIRAKYPRKQPTQAEIDVINNGGRI